MKQQTYTGVFENADGHVYDLSVRCFGTIQALILLTADAIRSGRHYQIKSIKDEYGNLYDVESILKIGSLISKR